GRQQDSTAVGFRFVARQTERARAYDAAIDHELVKIVLAENLFAGLRRRLLVLFADGYFVAMQRGFNAVDKTHTVGMRAVIGGLDDFAHCAARAQYLAGGVVDLYAGHHLRAGRQNEMKLGRQLISHDTPWILRERSWKGVWSSAFRRSLSRLPPDGGTPSGNSKLPPDGGTPTGNSGNDK